MADPPALSDRPALGILDTSVVIDILKVDAGLLPRRVAISAITLAELSAGPAATGDPVERARRQDRLQRVEATFEALPVDAEVARAYGRVLAAVAQQGRTARRRFADLLLVSTALAEGVPLVTRNGADFAGLDDLVEIIVV